MKFRNSTELTFLGNCKCPGSIDCVMRNKVNWHFGSIEKIYVVNIHIFMKKQIFLLNSDCSVKCCSIFCNLPFSCIFVQFHISSDLMCFHLGITDDFVGNTAVNSRFLVLAFSRAYERRLVRLVAIYFATATWLSVIERVVSRRESLIIDITFPRRRRSGNSSDRPWYVDKVTR